MIVKDIFDVLSLSVVWLKMLCAAPGVASLGQCGRGKPGLGAAPQEKQGRESDAN